MAELYDLVVIGAGTAASAAIGKVARAGWRTAIIDYRPYGGTCALRGCDPKKMMVSAEEALSAWRHMLGNGIDGELRIDWPALQRFKRSFTDPIPEKREKHFRELGVDTLHGTARFTAPDAVEVDGRELKFRHALIATGARPAPLGIPGEALIATSDDFLELEALPRRILFIGGGYIAAEFSHLAARAGAEVIVIQRGQRLLKNFDPDMVDLLVERFEELGIRVLTDAEVFSIERNGPAHQVRVRSKDGNEHVFEADLVVHAGGRVPDIESLDLAAGGIETWHGRLKLTEKLQSISNERVFAAGDAAGKGPPLTPVTTHDAGVVADNLLHGSDRTPDYRGVPSVAFTVPAIAAVGLSEEDARKGGDRIKVNCASTPDWFTARRLGETIYGHKILIDPATDEILGAHLVGPHAEDVINLFGAAIRHGLTAGQLSETIFSYPTGASDISSMLA